MDLFKKILLMIVSPGIGWERINKLSIPTRIMLGNVFYPTLAVVALSVFVRLFYDDDLTLTRTLINAIIAFTSYFFAFHISSGVMNFFLPGENQEAKDRMDNLLLFGLEFLALLNVINNLLPSSFAILDLLNLYVGFDIYTGLNYINYEGKAWVFVVGTSAMLLLIPIIITSILEISLCRII